MTRFDELVQAGHVVEDYGADAVVISCPKCDGVRWERNRRDGRAVTVADRDDAVRHFQREHAGLSS